jgi:hypothetical protein
VGSPLPFPGMSQYCRWRFGMMATALCRRAKALGPWSSHNNSRIAIPNRLILHVRSGSGSNADHLAGFATTKSSAPDPVLLVDQKPNADLMVLQDAVAPNSKTRAAIGEAEVISAEHHARHVQFSTPNPVLLGIGNRQITNSRHCAGGCRLRSDSDQRKNWVVLLGCRY